MYHISVAMSNNMTEFAPNHTMALYNWTLGGQFSFPEVGIQPEEMFAFTVSIIVLT